MFRYFLFFMSFCLVINLANNTEARESEMYKIKLYAPGTEDIVDYEKYGEFKDVGTKNYKYVIKDKKGLSQAVGEGIFPNTDVLRDPLLQKYREEGKLKGSRWDFLNSADLQTAFLVWATTPEEAGVKLFNVATIFEKANLIKEAIKAYYAVVVHFPKTVGWTTFHTPWYPGPSAIDKIEYLCRTHPEVGMKLVDAKITIKGRYDDNLGNDVFITRPGKIIRCKPEEAIEKINLSKMAIIKKSGFDYNGKKNMFSKTKSKISELPGQSHVGLVQYENGHWQLLVNGEPFIIQAVAYSPNKTGLSPDNGTLVVHKDWMLADFNHNGKIDGPYDVWVDNNKNNRRDEDEPVIGDFELMKQMGVNTIRLYHHSHNKKLLQDLYKNYGIMVLMGDYLGMYAVGSGVDWYKGTDYTDPQQCENMMNSVKEMVMEHKNEPYILMWVLGNENNYGSPGIPGHIPGLGCQAKNQPEAYYKFVNKIAKWIKSVDPNHPVAICNGDLLYLDKFSKYCPDVDVYGTNAYRGTHGFGRSLWEGVKDECDKPVLITEYGCPAYMNDRDENEACAAQAEYHRGNWEDIFYNSAGYGIGNSIGGVIFEWTDEWWKAGPPPELDPSRHESWSWNFKTKRRLPSGNFAGPFPDGWMHEEWLGICSQGDGSKSPFLRQLRPVYYEYQKMWKGGDK